MQGQSVGPYQVLEKIGEGGMGAVYKARDTRLNRTVALKVLPPDKVIDQARKSRFLQEARAASSLNHPNIITVHDIVSREEGDCIVMEYVTGRPLSDMIAEGAFRTSEALKCAAQVADALAAAHSAGIIHRDLKPTNIMVLENGLVKVLDFGLAKLLSETPASCGPTLSLPLTDSGVIIGTPGYMSPEQVKGEELDRRSDIFNFGLVLYEMLSGTKAFQGETAIEVMNAILKEEPAVLPESVPGALRQVVAVCIEKKPVNRFESARDLGFALKALAAGPTATGPAPLIEAKRPKLSWKYVWPASAVILAGLALFIIARDFFRSVPLDLSAYKYSRVAVDPEPEFKGVWSPDGRSIAYLREDDSGVQLMTWTLAAPLATVLHTMPKDRLTHLDISSWSPDGTRLFFISKYWLWSIGSAGGEPQQVLQPRVYAADISPDGKALAAWRSVEEAGKYPSTIWISPPSGAEPRKYEPAPFGKEAAFTGACLRFSPDGKRIGLAINGPGGGSEFWLLDWPDGPRSRQRLVFKKAAFTVAPGFDWMPDSRHMILSSEGNLWLGDIVTGQIQKLSAYVGSSIPSATAPSVSPDGKRIAFTLGEADFDIFEIPHDGSKPRPFLTTTRPEYSPSWALSGEQMAYITRPLEEYEIWLRNKLGDWKLPIISRKDFPDDPGSISWAGLSPDAKRIAFETARGTRRDVWVSPAAGGTPTKIVLGENVTPYGLSWSPDGARIAIAALLSGKNLIMVVTIGGGEPAFLIPGSEGLVTTAPAWSPDGRWIAWGSIRESSIFLVSPDGENLRRLPSPVVPSNQDYLLVWSKDSTTLFVASSVEGKPRLDAVDIRTEKSRKISDLGGGLKFQVPNNYCLTGSLSPDGKSFTTSVRADQSDLWILEGFPQPGRRRR